MSINKGNVVMSCVGVLVVLFISLGMTYGMFCLHRWVNWKMYYEDKVKESIRQYHEEATQEETDDE